MSVIREKISTGIQGRNRKRWSLVVYLRQGEDWWLLRWKDRYRRRWTVVVLWRQIWWLIIVSKRDGGIDGEVQESILVVGGVIEGCKKDDAGRISLIMVRGSKYRDTESGSIMVLAMILRQPMDLGMTGGYGGGYWLRKMMDHNERRKIVYIRHEISNEIQKKAIQNRSWDCSWNACEQWGVVRICIWCFP